MLSKEQLLRRFIKSGRTYCIVYQGKMMPDLFVRCNAILKSITDIDKNKDNYGLEFAMEFEDTINHHGFIIYQDELCEIFELID